MISSPQFFDILLSLCLVELHGIHKQASVGFLTLMESLRYCKVLAHTGSHHGPTVSGSHWQVTTRNWIFDLSFLQSQLHVAAWEHNITVGCYSLDIFHQNTCIECFY